MSKKIIPVLFVLLLLAGCSANKELPQNIENTFSSVSKSTEVLQDEAVTDEPTSTITETVVSSTETEVIAEPTKSREVEDTEPTFTSGSNQQKETVPEAADSKSAETSEQTPTQPKTETVETEKEPTNTQLVEHPDENATQPTGPETQVPRETETPEPTESFDIDYWIDFARSYAQSIGLGKFSACNCPAILAVTTATCTEFGSTSILYVESTYFVWYSASRISP